MEIRLLVFLHSIYLLREISAGTDLELLPKKSKDQFARLPHNRVGAIIKKPQWKLTSDVKKKRFRPSTLQKQRKAH